ncbi:MAG: Fic family protein [Myxococcales bacterium]|nr:Fic family protein [Myxococcales bacterium]
MDVLRDHPWICFRPRFELTQTIQRLAGRAEAMLEELQAQPIKPQLARRLEVLFLSKSIHGTTSIEGGTLTEAQVQAILEGATQPDRPSRQHLVREVLNLQRAYAWAGTQTTEALVASAGVRHLHRLIAQDLEHIEAEPGRYRSVMVYVGSPPYRPPSDRERDLEGLMHRLGEWLGTARLADSPFLDALLRAVIAHVYVAWIHPFQDGNGRTARTLEFGLLLAGGVPRVGALALSNHYNLTRSIYMRRLSRSSTDLRGDLTEFIEYALQGFHDGLADALARVREHVMNTAWESYVYESFRNQAGPALSPAQARARRLAIEMTTAAPLTRAELANRFELLYAGRSAKTLTRDLNLLESMRLLERVDGRYQSAIGQMRRFTLGWARERRQDDLPPEHAPVLAPVP